MKLSPTSSGQADGGSTVCKTLQLTACLTTGAKTFVQPEAPALSRGLRAMVGQAGAAATSSTPLKK